MKYISERISFHRHKNYITVLISSKVEKWKESLLFGWMVLWLLIGVAILFILVTGKYLDSSSVGQDVNQLQMFLLLFLVFWGYYFYKIIRVYWWRKKGVEYFKLTEDSLVVKKSFGKYGKAHSFLYDNMEPIKLLERKESSFSSVMQSAFWDIGNESLSFNYFGKAIIFGIQLDVEESKKLKHFMITEINKIKNK